VPGTPVAERLGFIAHVGSRSGLGPLELDPTLRDAEFERLELVLRVLDIKFLATANRTFHFLTPHKFSAVGGKLS
jgi:hypothetical protein